MVPRGKSNRKDRSIMARIIDPAEEMREYMARFDAPMNAFLNEIRCDESSGERNLLKEFSIGKRTEGCSIETLRSYFTTIRDFLFEFRHVDISNIDGADVRTYLVQYQTRNGISNASLDNMRRNLNSFFNYLVSENYLDKNPMMKVHKIKSDSTIKLPFTEEELEKIRDACCSIRELALIDFLYSTGVRVSECVNCDIEDFNMVTQEGIVYGKGGKERVVYLDTRSKLHLQRYLKHRKDRSPALFVRPVPPFVRMTKSGIEYIVRDIGKRANVEGVHPHRFRRTLATRLLERGMPIEQVQTILGHSKIDTTLIYAKVNQSNVKINHAKYV